MNRSTSGGLAAAFVLSINYGVAGCFSREIQRELEPFGQLTLQCAIGAMLVLLLFWVIQGKIRLPRLSIWGALKVTQRAMLTGFIGGTLFIEANNVAPVAHVTIIQILPIGVVWAWLLFGERISARQGVALGVGFAGTVMLFDIRAIFSGRMGEGELLSLLSVLSIALGFIATRALPAREGYLAATFWTLVAGSILSLMGALAREGGISFPSRGLAPLFVLNSAMVGLNAFLALAAFGSLPAARATAVLTMESVWAIIAGWLLYGEVLSAAGIAGGALILVSALWMTMIPVVRVCAKSRTTVRQGSIHTSATSGG